jgi:hypothetical protein
MFCGASVHDWIIVETWEMQQIHWPLKQDPFGVLLKITAIESDHHLDMFL